MRGTTETRGVIPFAQLRRPEEVCAFPIGAAPSPAAAPALAQRPTLPTGIEERFAARPASAARGALVYMPMLLASASPHYVRAPAKLDVWQSLTLVAPLDDASAAAPWEALSEWSAKPALAAGPETGASFAAARARAAAAELRALGEDARVETVPGAPSASTNAGR